MRYNLFRKTLLILCLIIFIFEMTLGPKYVKDKTITKFRQLYKAFETGLPVDSSRRKGKEMETDEKGYISGVYYSNWSPYPPRNHFPHEIDFRMVTHFFYAFFVVNADTGECQSSDEWSDFEMDLFKQMYFQMSNKGQLKHHSHEMKRKLPKGVIGELFYLKYTQMLSHINEDSASSNFKTLMSVGGWSNGQAFPVIVRDKAKLEVFLQTCVDNMFKLGFDGIDIDWEFPNDDGFEAEQFLLMMQSLRERLNTLEQEIFGKSDHKQHFLLTAAIPATIERLKILKLSQMDKFVDFWNLMTYDFSGEWSEKTGYHSNLYNPQRNDSTAYTSGNSADESVSYLLSHFHLPSKKIILGIPAYGRGFTNIKLHPYDDTFVGKTFKGVGGASEGEPGMWLYNQLPLAGTKEMFDENAVSAYCVDVTKRTFVGYDNVQSMKYKANYVVKKKLGGAFWWESCGDDHKNSSRSLLTAFNKEIKSLRKKDTSIYALPQVSKYYLTKYSGGHLSQVF
ncbi:LAFE_0F03422g1_1 [Lachancea fermentati]|uniref:chitinase n=1 Tax=Lachancea fermentati TaxID=4955 RepID=A0A1G4MEE9_LACFM|nr:LAFE_0F03422g1_1 [Lachancea fermentati]